MNGTLQISMPMTPVIHTNVVTCPCCSGMKRLVHMKHGKDKLLVLPYEITQYEMMGYVTGKTIECNVCNGVGVQWVPRMIG